MINQSGKVGTLLSAVNQNSTKIYFKSTKDIVFNEDSDFMITTNSGADKRLDAITKIHKVVSLNTNAKRLYEYARKDTEISPLFELVGKLPQEDYRVKSQRWPAVTSTSPAVTDNGDEIEDAGNTYIVREENEFIVPDSFELVKGDKIHFSSNTLVVDGNADVPEEATDENSLRKGHKFTLIKYVSGQWQNYEATVDKVYKDNTGIGDAIGIIGGAEY